MISKKRTRTVTEEYTVPHTRDGVTVHVPRKREVEVPVLPRDWDRLALRTTTGLVLALTLVSVAWSTMSIGAVLGGGVGYLAATVFDIAWAVCLLLEWMARFTPRKRTFPKALGWGLLALTMGAIFWNGWLNGSVAMAVVGAVVSFVAKMLWWGVSKHVDKELSDDDAYWVAAQISSAYAMMAVAQARRQVARIQHQAAAELLAMEAAAGIPQQESAAPDNAAQQRTVPDSTGRADATVRSAVRAALHTTPEATADDVVEQLARVGIDVTTQTVMDLAPAVMRSDTAGDTPMVSALPDPVVPEKKAAAILAAAAALQPNASHAQVALHLAQQGVPVDTAYVRTVRSRAAKQARTAQARTGTEGYL